jgi:hypothetical protein
MKITYVICSIPSYVLNFGHFFHCFFVFAKDYFCDIINLDSHDKYNRSSFKVEVAHL